MNISTNSNVSGLPSESVRYHGLDALRGTAMLLGIVLHAALPYIPNVEAFWPVDESSSPLIATIFLFIHIWRMPLFFILAGFFANLVISRRSWKSWWGNRLLRVGLPIIVFFPLMSLTLPWIFTYGGTREFVFFYSNEGQPFHLWFLWHLLIFMIVTCVFRFPYLLGVRVLNGFNRIGWSFIGSFLHRSRSTLSVPLFRSRYPVVLMILCTITSLPTQGELIVNPIVSGLYFTMGFTLYGNASLFAFMKVRWRSYFLGGIVSFTLYMMLESRNSSPDIYGANLTGNEYFKAILATFVVITVSVKTISAVLFSYAFVGLAEKHFGSYNPRVKFISDGAYWMYLIHLPIVTFITFFMFNLQIPIEIKFVTAILMTSIICMITYKIFVRSTPIGILLNGKNHPFQATKL